MKKNILQRSVTVILNFAKNILKKKKIYLNYFHWALIPVIALSLYALVFQACGNAFNRSSVLINVPQNAYASAVLWELKAKKIVNNYYNAKIVMVITGYDKHLHAGMYDLNRAMSLSTIFAVLREKKGLSLTSNRRLIIPEGFSLQEIIDRLDEESVVSRDAMTVYLKQLDRLHWQTKYPFLKNIPENKIDNLHYFEGYVVADTYYFAENTDPEAVLDNMLSNFQRNILPLFKENTTSLNVHQLITLASIVEKEAVTPEEHKLIAGIFYNRLKKWMYLGSCPTVKYALGKPRKKFLLYKDLDVISPYNTYRHLGLPPGPICSPSLASIRAVLNPEKTGYFYFLAKGDGTHIFSITLDEHINHQRQITGGKIIY